MWCLRSTWCGSVDTPLRPSIVVRCFAGLHTGGRPESEVLGASRLPVLRLTAIVRAVILLRGNGIRNVICWRKSSVNTIDDPTAVNARQTLPLPAAEHAFRY